MKPWEGKHFQEKLIHSKYQNEKFDTGEWRSDPWASIYQYMRSIESALKKDWEDQQNKPANDSQINKYLKKDPNESCGSRASRNYCLCGKCDPNVPNYLEYERTIPYRCEKCEQTAESEMSGHQELFRPRSFLAEEREDRLIKNLFSTVKMQQKEISELKNQLHDTKKDESFTSSNWIKCSERKPTNSFQNVFVTDGELTCLAFWVEDPIDYYGKELVEWDDVLQDEVFVGEEFRESHWRLCDEIGPFVGNDECFGIIREVTHWMPLPKPPEKE